MACFHPIRAFQLADRSIKFIERGDVRRVLDLPCGQCVGCRLERSRQWAVRCMHECQSHEFSSFATLTYSGDVMPSLSYRDFQLFMKRLRHSFPNVRFYMCGEYGGDYGRPHFHAILFGVAFSDRLYFRESSPGCKIYTSQRLSSIWGHGFASVGDVTFDSAAYVARYACKSALPGHDGKRMSVDSGFVDCDTGEYWPFVREFNRMSLGSGPDKLGGIGCSWFKKYRAEVFENDYVVLNGVKMKPPKYYKHLLEVCDAESSEFVSFQRGIKAEDFAADNSDVRLAVRERVTKARLSFKSRSEL